MTIEKFLEQLDDFRVSHLQRELILSYCKNHQVDSIDFVGEADIKKAVSSRKGVFIIHEDGSTNLESPKDDEYFFGIHSNFNLSDGLIQHTILVPNYHSS